MKKTIAILYVYFLIVIIMISSFFSGNIFMSSVISASETSEWTFMMYLDGDNNLENSVLEIFNHIEIGKKYLSYIEIIVLVDRNEGYTKSNNNWADTRIFKILLDDDKNKIKSLELENLGERNMGHQSTLEYFIDFCISNYSNEHYLLNLYDHGSGIYGMCFDETSGNDCLNIYEIKCAIENNKLKHPTFNLDILIFSACNMASIEVMYELQHVTKYFLSSQYYTYGGNLQWDDILERLSKIELNPINLINTIIDSVNDKWKNSDYYTTFSALDLMALPNRTLINNFIDELNYAKLNCTCFKILFETRRKTQDYSPGSNVKEYPFSTTYHSNTYIDLIDFINKLKNHDFIQKNFIELLNKSNNLLLDLNNSIISNFQHPVYNGCSNGISIFFPYHHCNLYAKDIINYYRQISGLQNLTWFNEIRWSDFINDIHIKDSDDDELLDWYEIGCNLKIDSIDSDNDLIPDNLDDEDYDNLSNEDEYSNYTDPLLPDTDFDLLSDYEEVVIQNTNPLKEDSDKDGFNDFEEISLGFDALDNKSHPFNYNYLYFLFFCLVPIHIPAVILIIKYNKIKKISIDISA